MKNTSTQASAHPNGVRLNRLIFLFALLGVLVVVHLWIQTGRGFDRGCFGFNDPADVDTVGCTAVVQSDAGTLFGISNAVWGLLFFASIAALSLAQLWTKGDQTRTLHRLSTAMVTAGFVYALYLFLYQVFALGQFCKLCLISGTVTLILFILHLLAFRQKVWPQEGPVRNKEHGRFGLALTACLALIAADFTYFNRLAPAAPAEAQEAVAPVPPPAAVDAPEEDLVCTYLERDLAPIADVGVFTDALPFKGHAEAPLRVVEFFDPNCPHCKTLHEYLQSFSTAYDSTARFYYQPFPIWPYSVPQVEALYLAADEGKFFEMLDLQFANQQPGQGLSIDALVALSRQLDMDAEAFRQGLQQGTQRGRIQEEHFKIRELGFTGVPRLTVEGRFIKPSTLKACLESPLPS